MHDLELSPGAEQAMNRLPNPSDLKLPCPTMAWRSLHTHDQTFTGLFISRPEHHQMKADHV